MYYNKRNARVFKIIPIVDVFDCVFGSFSVITRAHKLKRGKYYVTLF